MKIKKLLFITLLFICSPSANSQERNLTVGPMFTDHAILQQGQPIPIWGKARKGATVTVKFGKVKTKTKADSKGNWKIMLPAQQASFNGQTLTVCSGKDLITLNDVVVGEIWVAAGQSNMEYTMRLHKTFQKPYKGKDLAAEELEKPTNERIRIFNCPRKGKNNGWRHAGGETLAMASAPGYFCVKHLQDSLGVPVGIISTAVGGTVIDSWQEHGNWYEKMIAPYVPYAVRGILWYQGENNCARRERSYASKFKKMTAQWRTRWNVADMPFLTVMLAPHIYSNRKHRNGTTVDAEELPAFRMQQMACLDSVANTEIIFNPDLVDDLLDIHHSYKWEVGRRMAVMALNRIYGRKELEWSGPRAISATATENGAVIVKFIHADGGLTVPESKMIRWFEVADSNGIWHSANAELTDSQTVRISSYRTDKPVAVRYLWHETAVSTDLCNKSGLCALPFKLTVE